MRKLIEVSREMLIVCDNPKCGYNIPYNKDSDTDLKKYINTPCPECGQNLLTEEDYLRDKKVMQTINFINKWFSWMTIFIRKPKVVTGSIYVHNGIQINSHVDGPGK